MSPSLRARLKTLRQDLDVLVNILAREQWSGTPAWRSIVAELDALESDNADAATVASWASNVSYAFGTGMGSLSDVFLGDDFEEVRNSVQRQLWEIIVDARTAPESLLRVRRRLTELETTLLDAGHEELAGAVRRLLSDAAAFNLSEVDALIREARSRIPSGTTDIKAALSALELEVAQARQGTPGAS